MKQKLILISAILYSVICFSQNKNLTPYFLTKKENIEWIKTIEELPIDQQLIQIKTKIEVDKKFIKQTKYLNIGNHLIGDRLIYIDKKELDKDRENSDCECKIGFYLDFKKESYILDLSNKYTSDVLKLLSINNIRDIHFGKRNNGISNDNIRRCGLVLIRMTKNKDVSRRLKNIL